MCRKLESRWRQVARRQFDRKRTEIGGCGRLDDGRPSCRGERVQLERCRNNDPETAEGACQQTRQVVPSDVFDNDAATFRELTVGTRELDGLKVLMVLLANYDTRLENNRVLHQKHPETGEMEARYVVTDIGATLGNDVNLRDFEGRSALLLGKAKDNNASCAIGPFIRLFDEHFGIDDVRKAELALHIEGPDGFAFTGHSSMAEISRDPLDIVSQAIGPNHQYPDGFVLFLGTMFAPTVDRFAAGKGFTHAVGDIVTVTTPALGALVNRVNYSDAISAWSFGTIALMKNLAARRLI